MKRLSNVFAFSPFEPVVYIFMHLASFCKTHQPGESWLLEDGCHSLLCHPSGMVTLQNHKVSCDRLEPPACRNNMPPIKVQETCSCHWECPCTYIEKDQRDSEVLSAHLIFNPLHPPHPNPPQDSETLCILNLFIFISRLSDSCVHSALSRPWWWWWSVCWQACAWAAPPITWCGLTAWRCGWMGKACVRTRFSLSAVAPARGQRLNSTVATVKAQPATVKFA